MKRNCVEMLDYTRIFESSRHICSTPVVQALWKEPKMPDDQRKKLFRRVGLLTIEIV